MKINGGNKDLWKNQAKTSKNREKHKLTKKIFL